jgi:hypothetical protein
MPTATKEQSPSAELCKLTAKRERAHEKLQEPKAKLQAWDTEGLPPDIRPGTGQAEIHAASREREEGPNPHRENYDAAFAEFTEADEELQRFQRENVRERIAEVGTDAAADKIREGLVILLKGCEDFRADTLRVREIVVSTPGMDGRDYGYDPRPDQWAQLAAAALDSEIVPAGLTELGNWKADRR